MSFLSVFLPFARANFLTPQFASPVRSGRWISIFSSFRLKREAEKEESERAKRQDTTTDDDKVWSEAAASFQPIVYTKGDDAKREISRVEIRRLKKQAFLHIIQAYLQRYGKSRRSFNQFVNNALDKMLEYEVQGDLECYKAILSVFPTGRMVVTNFLQAELGHYTRQQNTALRLLRQMTVNRVIPDDEVGQMIIDIFGWRNHVMQHYRYLMYWIPKLAHINPWPVDSEHLLDDLEQDPLRLCRLIAERICPDRMTELRTIKLSKDYCPSDLPCSMISAQSPEQRALLSYALSAERTTNTDQLPETVIYLDGPHFVWYQRLQAAYYTLWTELDRRRLQPEIERAKQRQTCTTTSELSKISSICPPGCAPRTHLDEVPSHSISFSKTTTPSLTTTQDDSLARQSVIDANNALLRYPSVQISRLQPEYDNRWSALRQSHSYAFLPSELTTHEQAEGTILAVGVVTPIADALLHQKYLFDRAVSTEPHSDTSADTSPLVPHPATSELIRAWLQDLQHVNPSLENATLVIRTRTTPSESGGSYTSPADYYSDSQHRICSD